MPVLDIVYKPGIVGRECLICHKHSIRTVVENWSLVCLVAYMSTCVGLYVVLGAGRGEGCMVFRGT